MRDAEARGAIVPKLTTGAQANLLRTSDAVATADCCMAAAGLSSRSRGTAPLGLFVRKASLKSISSSSSRLAIAE
eukprot:scaffold256449_cov28-Tisochrysis_lutea.AAC.8